MNIFPLDSKMSVAAKYNCDAHVSKIILEIAQMLSCAFKDSIKDPKSKGIYRSAYVNHPMTVWARTSIENFKYMVRMGEALNKEKVYRFGKDHKSVLVIRRCLELVDHIEFPEKGRTPIPQCMPDEYKGDCSVEAYRRYYIGEKQHIAKWTNRETPPWFNVVS